MNGAGYGTLVVLLGMIAAVGLAYAGGRVHQWARHSADREESFREGYDLAAQKLFTTAVRATQEPETPRSVHRVTPFRRPRHSAELQGEATTIRLPGQRNRAA